MTNHHKQELNMAKKTFQNNAFDYPNLSKMSPDEFYSTYKNFMLAVARQEKIDHYQADLAIDDVMLKIFVKHNFHFDPKKSPFSNYLATAVRNACRSLKRRDRKYNCFEEDTLVNLCESQGAVTRDKELEAKEIRQWIDKGIGILRQKVRSQQMVDVLVMAVMEDERPLDVARKMNVRADYVSLVKNRCLPRLQAILESIADAA